jgi:hypothetical protein
MPEEQTPPRKPWSGRMKTGVATLVVVALATTGGIALGAAGRVSQQTPGATATSNAEELVGIQPVRVLDTRPPADGPIGVPAAKPISGGQTIDVQVAGFKDKSGTVLIPADATSVAANITIDEDATLKSFLTVWPTGQPQPLTSANNAEPGLVVANSAILKLGTGGKLSVFNQRGDVNVIIDITGFFVACGAAVTPPSGGTTTTTAATTTSAGATTTTAPAGATCTPPSGPTPPGGTTTTTATTAPTTTTTTTAPCPEHSRLRRAACPTPPPTRSSCSTWRVTWPAPPAP